MSSGQPRFEAALLRPFDARQLLGQANAIHGSRSVSSDPDTFLIFLSPLSFALFPKTTGLIPYWNTVMNLAEWTMVLLRPRLDALANQKG